MTRPTLTAAVLLAGLALGGLSCGKKGAPQPPYQPDPQAVTELKIGQQGDRLVVSYVTPRETVDAQRLDVHDVEIFVADKPGEVVKVGRLHRVRVAPGENRSELLPAAEVDTSLRVAARARNRGRSSALTKVLTLTIQPAPAGPTGVEARNDPAGIVVAWQTPAPTAVPSASPTPAAAGTPTPRATPTATPVSGYQIRRRGPGGTASVLTEKPIAAPPFLDDTALTSGRWCYTVRRVVSLDPLLASAETPEACVDVKDVRPPQSPSGLAVAVGENGLNVTWNAPADADVARYRVYRSAGTAEPQKIGETAAAERSFADTTAAPGTAYRYRVTAVDTAGNESAPSPPAEAARP